MLNNAWVELSRVFNVQFEDNDVYWRKKRVERLLNKFQFSFFVSYSDLKCSWKHGNPNRVADKELSLAFPYKRFLGILGLDCAEKTTFSDMIIGPFYSNSETEYIARRRQTLFHRRLKNMKSPALSQEVEGSLKSFYLSMIMDHAIAHRHFVDTRLANKFIPAHVVFYL